MQEAVRVSKRFLLFCPKVFIEVNCFSDFHLAPFYDEWVQIISSRFFYGDMLYFLVKIRHRDVMTRSIIEPNKYGNI